MFLRLFFRISLVFLFFVMPLSLPSFSKAEPPQTDDNKISGQWEMTLKLKCKNFQDTPRRSFKIRFKEKINLIWNEPSNKSDNFIPGFAMMANFATLKPTGSSNLLMEGKLYFDFPYNYENTGQCNNEAVDCFVDADSKVTDGWLVVENIDQRRFKGQCRLNLQGYWRKSSDEILKRNKLKGWGYGYCWERNTVDIELPSNSFAGMCDVNWKARWREPLQ